MDTTITVTTPACFVCHEHSEVIISQAGYALWQAGTPIQDAFPGVPAGLRETIKTGIHPDCWDYAFGTDEDDDEDEED